MPDFHDEFSAAENSFVIGLEILGAGLSHTTLQASADKFVSSAQGDTVGHEIVIFPSRRLRVVIKHLEDFVNDLAGQKSAPHDAGMPAPSVGVKLLHQGDEAGSQWIEVNVADELQKMGVFLAHNRLVSVLEEAAAAMMAKVEDDCITGQQALHQSRQGTLALGRAEKGMCVV